MGQRARGRLGPAGRVALVRLMVEDGHWLRHYNERRPHSSLGNRPPISRAHNLSGQDT